MAVRKPHKDAMAALTGGPKEQIEFLLYHDPLALADTIHYGDQNVYVKKRELRAAVAKSWARIQAKQRDKEARRAAERRK